MFSWSFALEPIQNTICIFFNLWSNLHLCTTFCFSNNNHIWIHDSSQQYTCAVFSSEFWVILSSLHELSLFYCKPSLSACLCVCEYMHTQYVSYQTYETCVYLFISSELYPGPFYLQVLLFKLVSLLSAVVKFSPNAVSGFASAIFFSSWLGRPHLLLPISHWCSHHRHNWLK